MVLFDRYRLEGELGRGGVADVWRAADLRLDRPVAIKVLHPHLLPDADWRRRFIAEARAASSLSHPGIVPVYDVIDDESTPAIVFQLVEGESLGARIRREGTIPIGEAARIGGEVARALDHAHRAGLVHRDVKPANILIEPDGRARLVDFGIARVLGDAGSELTGAHEVVGTLRYMAPEQLAGAPADERTDLFALGLVLAEMVPDLDSAPPWFRDLVTRLRAADPADRPSSAADVARALETGRLDAHQPDMSPREEAGDPVATPVDDPDAMTRRLDRGEASGSAAAAENAAASVLPAAPGVVAPAPATGRVRRRSRTDRRPVAAAILVTAVVLGALALSRSDLFGRSSASPSGSPTATPHATTRPTPTPVHAVAPAPAGGGRGPKKGHGHGHGKGD